MKPRAIVHSGYIPTLDGWRALSIAGVILYHDHVRSIGLVSTYLIHNTGELGVDLFFAISGYLITTRILQEEESHSRLNLRGFYIRRAFRILPAALLYLLVISILSFFAIVPTEKGGIIAALFFYRNYYAQYHHTLQYSFTAHFWSLSIEEQFYLVLPSFLFFVLARKSRSICLAAAVLAFISYTIAAPRIFPHIYDAYSLVRTEMHVYGILFSSLLAIVLTYPEVRILTRRFLHPYAVLLGLGLLYTVTSLRHLHGFGHIIILGLALLVVSTTMHPNTVAGRFLELRALRIIGRMSYSIYLWQQLFFIDERMIPVAPYRWVDRVPLSYILLAVCAASSFYLVEKPLIRIGHRFAPPPTPGHKDLLVPST